MALGISQVRPGSAIPTFELPVRNRHEAPEGTMQQQQIRHRRTSATSRSAATVEVDRRTPGGRVLPF